MENVPEDVLGKAKRIADLAFGEADFGTVVDAIRDAILAERNRCAKLARYAMQGLLEDRITRGDHQDTI